MSAKNKVPFFMIDQAVLVDYDLNAYAFKLYAAITTHINHESNLAWPSYSRLEEVGGMARATVSKYLLVLEAKGLIEIIRSYKPGSKERANNQYRLLNPHRSPSAEGSSRVEPEVVHAMDAGSSSADTEVVHAANGNKTSPEQTKRTTIKPTKRERTPRAAQNTHAHPARQPHALPQKEQPLPLEDQIVWDMFCHQLADTCQLDFQANEPTIRRVARTLWRDGTGYTIDNLKTFESWWYAADWRGKKGDVPRLKEVVREIRKAVEALTPERNRYISGEYAAFIDY